MTGHESECLVVGDRDRGGEVVDSLHPVVSPRDTLRAGRMRGVSPPRCTAQLNFPLQPKNDRRFLLDSRSDTLMLGVTG